MMIGRTPVALATAAMHYQLALSRAFLPPRPPERELDDTANADHTGSASSSSRADRPRSYNRQPPAPRVDDGGDQDTDQGGDRDTPDTLLRREELDAPRDGEGPELPPALTLVVRGNGMTLADEPTDELLKGGLPDEPEGAMISCENPAPLYRMR